MYCYTALIGFDYNSNDTKNFGFSQTNDLVAYGMVCMCRLGLKNELII